MAEHFDTVIVGGGQAGLAMSGHLVQAGVPHLVLERNRIAESWRSARWDGLVANGPAWHDCYPGLEFPGYHQDDFVPKEKIADSFVVYAKKIVSPVRCGVEVTSVQKNKNRLGFCVETSEGVIDANYVVAATGAFQTPVIPAIVPNTPGIVQLHSAGYRNPGQLPDGAVLVVGAGASGAQISDELMKAGRQVYLSVGPHDRPPRRYRGRDFVWWLGVLGKWDASTPAGGSEHVTIAVSGADGGKTVDFRSYAAKGMTLVGRTESFVQGVVHFAPDLVRNIAFGDKNYLSVLDEADLYISRNGLSMPEEHEARIIGPDPQSLTEPILELNLSAAGISTIIWATGYANDYSWLKVSAVGPNGKPQHQRGVSSESGVYFLGLPWLSRRGSSFIWGVWHDAKFVADHIATQRGYLAYNNQ